MSAVLMIVGAAVLLGGCVTVRWYDNRHPPHRDLDELFGRKPIK